MWLAEGPWEQQEALYDELEHVHAAQGDDEEF
jgi:hypothetical protein